MHAYLVIGHESQELEREISNLAKSLGENIFEFPITKINEVRELTKFLKLSFDKPTVILIRNIETATEEALNAFLKTLEEPQKNVKFILTSTSEHKLLPTIISRCQIVRVKGKRSKVNGLNKNPENFIDMSVGEKIAYIDSIRKRENALNFIQDQIIFMHQELLKEKEDFKSKAGLLATAQNTLNRLNLNGNVGLQLTNFVINTSQK
ncbi:MAG: polymerase III, delta prime subunit protein [Candidatus Woesebacteria bacterium GW2011_GWC1_43_10b]|uniref:Polymerase III subunit delta'''' protein n=3 Tax=Candidatus Woeseibacteriota TaxID=1752722 RepID=A0A0G0PKU5_9BACT|nr:MAG: polymerase III subunit delta'''' protein [Candidatus Woesebacteria bacterium GW2011_GWA1_39_12]KKR01855.1 MAG: polymerase III subunit delta'''' protein [Candidatus Woesebacteria bacterium GW2011_GWB1_39_12]KKS80383.1 MAG: polymerase III, delta prime subunit protein [Candidatus Woesebacteria bacterium GW2011_GWC1_43_10b]